MGWDKSFCLNFIKGYDNILFFGDTAYPGGGDYYLAVHDRINKGIRVLEKEEKNIIKTLNYISKINKTKKEIKNLLTQQMKNLECIFQEDKTAIKYEEYYFNGIPEIKNIEFKDIGLNSFNVSWKLNDLNIIGIDKNQIKYKIEIRTKNKKFNKFMKAKIIII